MKETGNMVVQAYNCNYTVGEPTIGSTHKNVGFFLYGVVLSASPGKFLEQYLLCAAKTKIPEGIFLVDDSQTPSLP